MAVDTKDVACTNGIGMARIFGCDLILFNIRKEVNEVVSMLRTRLEHLRPIHIGLLVRV